MVVAAFPLAKLLYLAVRQVSKPIAAGIKTRAKASPFFRTYICMPPAQFYHWADVKIKMWVLNLGSPVKVAKLNEAQAIEQGAEILGETVIFGIAVACLFAEYVRSSRKEAVKEAAAQERLRIMEDGIVEVGMLVQRQDAQIRELTRALLTMKPKNVKIPDYAPHAVIVQRESEDAPTVIRVEPDNGSNLTDSKSQQPKR
ncbi:hypothetical protein RvY_02172-1 [Ramazzottius varieornatus]|uniref:OPA3-like protein n=1 Tax=Ramazzottius varieornatus TaxID=947166 RepID=A0A1D1UTE6_RAMVA|nr:hypothetical protein RvY_02172-1 [Ramazzottius varieornatus]